MPLFSSCIRCSSADEQPPLTRGDLPHLATTSSSDSATSSSSSIPSSSSVDDAVSIQTFPSLPTLHSLILPPFPSSAPLSASSSLLFSSYSSQNPPALALSSSLLFSFSPSSVAVFDLAACRQVLSLPSLPSAGAVKSALLAPSSAGAGGSIFTAHQDGKIRAWSSKPSDPAKLRLIAALPTAGDRLRRFALPSSYVAVRRHRKRLWIEHADAVSALAAAGGLLYSASWDKSLKIWRLSDLRCLESIKSAHDDAINAVAVGPDGTVYTGSADRKIKVWAPAASSSSSGGRPRLVLVATLERHKSAVNALAVSGDGSVLYSGACDRSVLVWEREDSANLMVCSGTLRGHKKAVMCLWTAGIDLVVSGSSDRTVRVWKRGVGGEGYSCLCTLEGHVRGVRSVAAAREPAAEGEDSEEESYRVCSGSLDGEVRVWRVRVECSKKSDNR